MRRIDLNTDTGERPEALRDGSEEDLIRVVTSVNIACGGHAGDRTTMEQTVRLAKKYGVSIGAHPSYPDRMNFGRLEMNLPVGVISDEVYNQVSALADVCSSLGAQLVHVKPHGALYNVAVNESSVAMAIADGVARVSGDLILVGLANSHMLSVWSSAGFRVAAEAFVDRAYELDGRLRSRKLAGALISDPHEAARRALSILQDGSLAAVDGSKLNLKAETLCIHGDTPNSVVIARTVNEALRKAGFELRGFS